MMKHVLLSRLSGLLLLTVLLSGCPHMDRAAATLDSAQGDPFPGPCAPESVQRGTCVPLKEGHTNPEASAVPLPPRAALGGVSLGAVVAVAHAGGMVLAVPANCG